MTYIIIFLFTYVPSIISIYYNYGEVEAAYILLMFVFCLLLALVLGKIINDWRKFSRTIDECDRVKKKILYHMAVKDISSYQRQLDNVRHEHRYPKDELETLKSILADVEKR